MPFVIPFPELELPSITLIARVTLIARITLDDRLVDAVCSDVGFEVGELSAVDHREHVRQRMSDVIKRRFCLGSHSRGFPFVGLGPSPRH